MVKRLILFICIVIIAATASACQSAESVAPEPTPIQWQRVTFFATLLQPGFAINIPAYWHYEVSDTGIIIYNFPRLLELQDDGAALPEGSVVANLTILSAADVQRLGARNAASIVDAFIGPTVDDALGPRYQDVETIAVNGRDSAQSYVSVGGSESLLLALELSDNYVLAIIVAPEGELQRKSDLLNQMFASLELRVSD